MLSTLTKRKTVSRNASAIDYRQYNIGINVLYNASLRAVEGCGWKVKHCYLNLIIAAANSNDHQPGEELTIRILIDGNMIVLSQSLTATINDKGKNKENVSLFFQILENLILIPVS
jgi:hypothetical protein